MDEELDLLLDDSKSGINHDSRPGTLTALCIISIVGSSLYLIKSIVSYFILKAANDVMQGFTEAFQDSDVQEHPMFKGGFGWVTITTIIELLACAGTLAAAILMLTRRKTGFMVYVIATVLFLAQFGWFQLAVIRHNGRLEFFEIIWLFLNAAVPVAFIVMYATHRKYLR